MAESLSVDAYAAGIPSVRDVLRTVVRRQARPVAIGALASSIHQACEALVPLAIGLVIQDAVAGGRLSSGLVAVAFVFGLFVVLASGGGVAFWLTSTSALREAHRLRTSAMARILAERKAGAGRTAGEWASIVTSDATAAAQAARAGSNIISGVVGLAVTAAVLLHIDVWLGLGILLTVPPLILGIDAISPRLEARLRERAQAGGLAAALAAELVHALGPLRAFGGSAQALRRYRSASSRCLDADIAAASANAVVSGVGLVATAIVTVGIAAAAGWMAFDGRIDVGQFVTVVAMASFVGDPVSRVAFGVQSLAAARASAARIAGLLGPDPVADDDAAHGVPVDSLDTNSVALREVTLGPVRTLTLCLDPGGVVGMVARDPAAVTAVLDVLTGETDPAEGTACLGERPLHTVGRRALRRHILVAPHEVQLLGRTLSDALDTGRGTDPARTAAALAAAVAQGLPDAMGEDGAYLSGGQRQRVALARAIAAASPVLVLRDPLTALDSVTEDQVAERLIATRRAQGGSTLVITTSPPLLSRCDHVIYIDEQGAAHIGIHSALINEPGYAVAVLR